MAVSSVRESGDALGQGFGRVALVSSGSRGIGAATVRRLAADGWDIGFCHHHDERSAVEAEKAALELGARVLVVQADLARAAEVASWVGRTEQELGPVQALVSCAGIARDQPLTHLADADWRAVIDTNLDGVFRLCRAVLPAMMARQSGRIVTVSSVSGVYGNAAERGLGAARAGIVGFTRALASQTRRYGIRANAVAPGAHSRRTDMTAIWPERTTARLTEAIALRRFASAAEAADRVAFLLSDAAADITGTVVEVPSTIGWPVGDLAVGPPAGWLGPVERLGVAERTAQPASTGTLPTCPRVHTACPVTSPPGSVATSDRAGIHAPLSRSSSTSLTSGGTWPDAPGRANAAAVIARITSASAAPSRLISTAPPWAGAGPPRNPEIGQLADAIAPARAHLQPAEQVAPRTRVRDDGLLAEGGTGWLARLCGTLTRRRSGRTG